MSKNKSVYFASALDTEEQRQKNLELVKKAAEKLWLQPDDFFIPQVDAGLCGDDGSDSSLIFISDVQAIANADLLVCNMDALDTGTAIELGYAFALAIPIVGITEKGSNFKFWNNMLKVVSRVEYV